MFGFSQYTILPMTLIRLKIILSRYIVLVNSQSISTPQNREMKFYVWVNKKWLINKMIADHIQVCSLKRKQYLLSLLHNLAWCDQHKSVSHCIISARWNSILFFLVYFIPWVYKKYSIWLRIIKNNITCPFIFIYIIFLIRNRLPCFCFTLKCFPISVLHHRLKIHR